MAAVPPEISDTLLRDWGWAGFPGGIAHDMNAFGAVLYLDVGGNVWVLSPADLEAYVISDVPNQLDAIWDDPVFQESWQRRADVADLSAALGPLGEGQIYALRIPEGLRQPGEGPRYDIELAAAYVPRMGRLAGDLTEAGSGCQVEIDETAGGPPKFTIVRPG